MNFDSLLSMEVSDKIIKINPKKINTKEFKKVAELVRRTIFKALNIKKDIDDKL